MSKDLEEPLHTILYELEVRQGLVKPKTFSCHHNRDVCSFCEMSVRRWIKQRVELSSRAETNEPNN